jgi:GxxExxY protein
MQHEFEPLSSKIIEAAIAVYRELGPGFLESIYQQALSVALRHREIRFECQKEITIEFDGVDVGRHVLDLVVNDDIVVELKAVKALDEIHFAQVRFYLKATGHRVGLLLNFNATTLVVKRVVLG